MTEQLTLDVAMRPIVATPHRRLSYEEQFTLFHEANPWVADALYAFTRRYLAAGHSRVSVKALFEYLRVDYDMRPEHRTSPWKLNNSLTSRYARHLIGAHPELQGVYETRELRSA